MELKDLCDLQIHPVQEKYLDAARWFVSGARGTGRSFLLAWAFVEWALKNMGMEVYVWDHITPKVQLGHYRSHLLDLVKLICSESAFCRQVTYGQDWFRIDPPKSLYWREK